VHDKLAPPANLTPELNKRDTSVGTAARYCLNWVLISGRDSVQHLIQRRIKRPASEVDHSPPNSAEVNDNHSLTRFNVKNKK
jgi:hypothetical protein